MVALDIWTFPLYEATLNSGLSSPSLFFTSDLWQPEIGRAQLAKITETSTQKNAYNHYNLTLKGSHHHNFDDLSIHIPYIGKLLGVLGHISPFEGMDIICAVTAAFLDKHLKSTKNKLHSYIERSSSHPLIRWDS